MSRLYYLFEGKKYSYFCLWDALLFPFPPDLGRHKIMKMNGTRFLHLLYCLPSIKEKSII